MLPGVKHNGFLKLLIGPMFAGKTSTLIAYATKYELAGLRCTIINHSSDVRTCDDRDGAAPTLGTHSGERASCVRATALADVDEDDARAIANSHVLLINEAQFFDDVVPWVKAQVEEHGKIVFVSGLDGDYRREKFGNWLDLIPYADEVEKVRALCLICKQREAPFSLRHSANSNQHFVGGQNEYSAACRTCYNTCLAKRV